MKPVHTPGPWHWKGYALEPVNPDPAKHHVHTILEAKTITWGFYVGDYEKSIQEGDANQRLIAAAPELLASVNELFDMLYRLPVYSKLAQEGKSTALDLASKAIARATIIADVCTGGDIMNFEERYPQPFTTARQLSDAAFNLDNLPRDNFTLGQIQDYRDCVDMMYSVATDLAGDRAVELYPDEEELAEQIEDALQQDCGCMNLGIVISGEITS